MPSGGFRPGAGRPRKSDKEKKAEGQAVTPKPPTMNASVVPTAARISKNNMKNIMADYFAMAMKECRAEVPSADVLRSEIEDYIAVRGCAGFVAPQTITDYVLNRQGFLACECMNRKIGRLTKEMKLSPYVTASQAYYKAMHEDFNVIMQAINKYGDNGQREENEFLKLLAGRGF